MCKGILPGPLNWKLPKNRIGSSRIRFVLFQTSGDGSIALSVKFGKIVVFSAEIHRKQPPGSSSRKLL